MQRGSTLGVLAFLIVGACTSPPAASPSPTGSPTIAPTPTPSPSSPPTASPAGRTFTQADFTRSGGCGDVFIWTTNADDTMALTVQWDRAATTAWEQEGFDDSMTLPQPAVQVFLVVGAELSQTYCTDIGGMGRVDGQAPAVSGTVELTVTPQAGGFEPAGTADVTLRDVAFDVVQGTETETWRIDQLELEDLNVGWFAG
jgi:hypothetical protein